MAGFISEGVADTLGGPVGAAATVVLEEAVSYAARKFAPGAFAQHSYEVGEWVQIDNGTESVDIRTKRLGEQLLGTMFEDFPDDEEWDMTIQESYSAGFVVEVGEKGSVTVYNFKYGKEQALEEAFLRPAGDAMSAKFDANVQLSSLRKLRLQLDRMEGSPLVDSPVNTDPGTEVYLDGQKYSIVQCIGTAALVENSAGHQVLADVKQLEPGPAKHSRRHNYRADGTVDDNMYVTEGGADLAQGMWVWLRPGPKALDAYSNCQAVLGCIMTIVGKTVRIASAWHGAIGEESIYAVVPVSEEIREVLNSWQHFAAFREAAVTGYAVKRKAPGNWYPEVCLGIGPLADLVGQIEFPEREESGEASGRVDRVTPGLTVGSGPGQLGEAGEVKIEEDLVQQGIPRETAGGIVQGAANVDPKAEQPVNYAVIGAVVAGAVVLVVYLR